MSRPELGSAAKNILLTGRPGSGKTTVVEAIVRRFAADAGGFVTGEIREKGIRTGFRITTLDGRSALLAHVNSRSPVRVGKYGVNVSDFERLALPAIENAVQRKRLVVIDEIGRMEMTSDAFCQAVRDALDARPIVLATIQQHTQSFTDQIKKRRDVALFQITPGTRNVLAAAIENMMSKMLQSGAAL
jgi:nucleoside-triphosphatase